MTPALPESATLQALPPMIRAYLWMAAGTAMLGGLLLLAGADGSKTGLGAASLFGGLALASAAATRLPARHLANALTTVFGAAVLAVGVAAVMLGWGLEAPALPLAGLVVCMACLAAGWRAGVVVAVTGTAAVLLVAVLAPGPAGAQDVPPVAVLLGTHLAAIVSGLLAGTLASRLMQRFATRAGDRYERSQGGWKYIGPSRG